MQAHKQLQSGILKEIAWDDKWNRCRQGNKYRNAPQIHGGNFQVPRIHRCKNPVTSRLVNWGSWPVSFYFGLKGLSSVMEVFHSDFWRRHMRKRSARTHSFTRRRSCLSSSLCSLSIWPILHFDTSFIACALENVRSWEYIHFTSRAKILRSTSGSL